MLSTARFSECFIALTSYAASYSLIYLQQSWLQAGPSVQARAGTYRHLGLRVVLLARRARMAKSALLACASAPQVRSTVRHASVVTYPSALFTVMVICCLHPRYYTNVSYYIFLRAQHQR